MNMKCVTLATLLVIVGAGTAVPAQESYPELGREQEMRLAMSAGPLTVSAAAKDVPSSVGGTDQFAFYEISGDIVLTAEGSTLRVPYLLVPRAQAKVSAELRIDKRFSSLTAPEVAAVEDH